MAHPIHAGCYHSHEVLSTSYFSTNSEGKSMISSIMSWLMQCGIERQHTVRKHEFHDGKCDQKQWDVPGAAQVLAHPVKLECYDAQ